MIIGTKEQLLRFSFVNVFEPKSVEGSDPKFSVQILVPKKFDKIVKQINTAIQDAITYGITKSMFTKAASNNPAFRKCVRDGDVEAAESAGGSKDYLKGHIFFNASATENNPPAVVDRFLKPIINSAEFYSGCYGVVDVNFFPFKFGKGGIAAGLNSIMKREDGERLDGRIPAEQAFSELKDEGDDDDDDNGNELL